MGSPPERPASAADPDAATAPAQRGAAVTGLEPGTTIAGHVIESRRGSGGFATVYRARDTRTGAAVALKVLHAYLARMPGILRRFQREAETIARLDHPGIVRLLGFGESGGAPYLAMEWVEGQTLAELIRDRGPLTLDEALPILDALADALSAAHGVGVVHRDLKAANVALAGSAVKLLDFGIAKLLDVEPGTGMTTAGTKIGTPHYMAPEQVLGHPIDHRADIYAFGILIFEMLTGRRPFEGANLAEIEERQLVEPPPAASQFAGVPPALDAVIRRAMDKDPANRHASIVELVAEVRAASAALAPIAAATAPAAPERRRAVGLYVHGSARHDDVGDDALELLDRVMDDVLAGAAVIGLDVAAETASSLLFVRVPMPGEAIDRLVDRVEALALTVTANAAHPELVIALTVHVAEVEVGSPVRYAGGALLDVASWAQTAESGVVITPY